MIDFRVSVQCAVCRGSDAPNSRHSRHTLQIQANFDLLYPKL